MRRVCFRLLGAMRWLTVLSVAAFIFHLQRTDRLGYGVGNSFVFVRERAFGWPFLMTYVEEVSRVRQGPIVQINSRLEKTAALVNVVSWTVMLLSACALGSAMGRSAMRPQFPIRSLFVWTASIAMAVRASQTEQCIVETISIYLGDATAALPVRYPGMAWSSPLYGVVSLAVFDSRWAKMLSDKSAAGIQKCLMVARG